MVKGETSVSARKTELHTINEGVFGVINPKYYS